VPPRKDRNVAFDLPVVAETDGAAQTFGAVLGVVAEGRITASEASALSD
jgi:hypothetical protein